MKQPKLKPCPFCGEIPLLYLHMGYYRIECQNKDCPSKLTASASKSDIVEAWNTRLKKKHPKVGMWIHRNDDHFDWYECSECGYGSEGEVEVGNETPCCPSCGARLEAEKINGGI